MKKLYLLIIGLALAASVAAVPASHQGLSARAITLHQATNAPFRDGLYLGTLTAKAGSAPHLATGRWAKDQDRLSFAAGYRLGYSQANAIR